LSGKFSDVEFRKGEAGGSAFFIYLLFPFPFITLFFERAALKSKILKI